MPTKLTKLATPTISKISNSKSKTVSDTFKKVSGFKGYEVKYGNNYYFNEYNKLWAKTKTAEKTSKEKFCKLLFGSFFISS